MKKVIVVSAINFIYGGPLSILKECLAKLSSTYAKDYEIIALVHAKELAFYEGVTYIEYPRSKKSWIFRLYYEYIGFYFLSQKIKPDFWFSLHDITPNIVCGKQFVYCHNPSPFYDVKKNDWYKNTKTYLFSKFYKYLYGLNIKRNRYVIVQQSWLRDFFVENWQLSNVVVAYPEVSESEHLAEKDSRLPLISGKKTLFYPSFPRPFKNFELVCEALQLMPLEKRQRLQVYLTLEKGLNTYADELIEKFQDIEEITFLGLLPREGVYDYYKKVDALVFPSRLETWGLPLTEFKATGKPIFLANLPYAKETLGSYDKVSFININSAAELSKQFVAFVDDEMMYTKNEHVAVSSPHTKGWVQLFDLMFENDNS